MGSRVRRPRPDAIYAELSSAVSDLAKSADSAFRRMALRAELTATIADTTKATQAAEALLAAAYPTESAKSVNIADKQTALRAELSAAIEDAAKVTQAAETLRTAACSTDLADQIQARLAPEPPVTEGAPPQEAWTREAVDEATDRGAEERMPPILDLYDRLGGFMRR